MRHNFKYTSTFELNIKNLKKKYPNVVRDFLNVLNTIDEDVEYGEHIPGLSKRIYKTRIPSTDMKRGKSGGFRTVYYVVNGNNEVIFLTIYSKSMQENIIPSKIEKIIKNL